MVRETATDDEKPQGTHETLYHVSKIIELNSMEIDPQKGEN
jgi:hypothetical protein